ncbi:MAG: diacylglycerol kinase family lipid kinase [Candidatus Solibacter usitatus]|nr:diacylglycerol kinase family lipid kinase [Candidatus Solibacter usitatus]
MNVYYDKLAHYRKAILIYNPNAGRIRGNSRLIPAVQEELLRSGHGVTPRPTAGPGHATELARTSVADGADLVLAAGGDGTINETLNGMVGSSVPLGVIPCGTANVFATETRMGGNAIKAAKNVGAMTPTRIALGQLQEVDGSLRRHFLLMAGAGLDAYIVVTVNPAYKRRLGKGAYWIAGFQSFVRRLEEMEVISQDKRQASSLALVSRVRNYGGDLEIAQGASLLRDDFEVVLFEGSNPLRYLKYLPGVLLRLTRRMSGVSVFRCEQLALHPKDKQSVYVQVDGEAAGKLPVNLAMVKDALTILLPPKFVQSERRRWTT